MKEINGKKYKRNDELQQYELVEFGRHKKGLKMKKQTGWKKIQVMAEPINNDDVCLFFDSISDCSKKFNVAISTIFTHMKNGNPYNGYVFKKVGEKTFNEIYNCGMMKSRAVILKHEKYGNCFIFPSLSECARKLGCHAIDVSMAIKSGKHINGFIVEEKIDDEYKISVKNDLENMAEIISALKSGKEVYCKKKTGGNWERVKCGACDFINYDYKIGCKMSDITVSVRIDECLKNKLDGLAKSKGISINSLLKDKLKKIVIEEFNMI